MTDEQILGGFANLHQTITAGFDEVRAEFRAVRAEMEALRQDLRNEIRQVARRVERLEVEREK